MTKRRWRTILAAALALSLAFCLTACGGGEEGESEGATPPDSSSGSASSAASAGEEQSLFPAALKDLPALQVPALEGTSWNLSGGMIDGVEMEEADLQATLEACGGMFQFAFAQNHAAKMIYGEKIFEGSREVVEEGCAIHAIFPGYEYYGVFTTVGDQMVLIIANPKAPETALYFMQAN